MSCIPCEKKKKRREEYREQNKLSSVEQKALRWESHIPLNTAILKTFPVTGVLECGAGNGSTRLFNNMGVPYLSIEQDKDWIAQLNLPNVIHYQCPEGYTRSTLRDKIPKEELDKFNEFCLNKKELWSNYLFIDQYAGYRLSSLVGLYKEFDVIAMHDTEIREDKCYGYSEFKPDNSYLYFRDSTWLANCGFLFKQHLIQYFPQFMSEFERQCQLFADKHRVRYEVKVIKC